MESYVLIIMTINEKTRKSRIVTWNAKKSAWEAKLAAATNKSDTTVAKLMIDEAEDALERLDVNTKAEVTDETKRKTSSKKSKSDTESHPVIASSTIL